MPLTLFLLRHAKSAWDSPSLEDFDRPLSERGRREAEWVADLIRTRDIRLSRILCSSAQRTRETLAALLPAFRRDTSIEVTRRLYEAPAERLLTVLREQLLTVLREQLVTDQAVMLIGHNPGLESLAGLLTGGGEPSLISALRRKYPPAGLAQFEFALEQWSDVGPAASRLVAFDVPSHGD